MPTRLRREIESVKASGLMRNFM